MSGVTLLDSSSSSGSDSSLETEHGDPNRDSVGTSITSPEPSHPSTSEPSHPSSSESSHPSSSEPKTLLSMYMNVEIGVVTNMEQQDEFLNSLADVKRAIAKTERRLARFRSKESSILHRLNCLREELADKRVEQANINMERTKRFRKQLHEQPRPIQQPLHIATSLSRPSVRDFDDARYF